MNYIMQMGEGRSKAVIRVLFVIFIVLTIRISLFSTVKLLKRPIEVSVHDIVTLSPASTETPVLSSIAAPPKKITIEPVLSNVMNNRLNEYRKSQGKSSVDEDTHTCDLAAVRVQEISVHFDHSGFDERRAQGTLGYPSIGFLAENIAMGSDPFQLWINSPVHNNNLLSDITYGCIRSTGPYYVFEGWRP